MNDMNFCIWCGSKLILGDKFCTNCGAKIEDMGQIEQTSTIIDKYESKLDDLSEKYETAEKEAYTIIEKAFKPPQMTYYKFADELEKCRTLFYKKMDSAEEIVGLINEELIKNNSKDIEEKLNIIIKKMESIIQRVNNLISEFIKNFDCDEEEKDIEELFENMDELIGSIKEYR